jgi:hypothetical protein
MLGSVICQFWSIVSCQDNVFVTVVASIQYRAIADKASDAFYKLSNTRGQIQSYVFDGMDVSLEL